jgi:hypothetical protein
MSEENVSNLTIRMTEENGNPVVWIDRDGYICIKQPHAPGLPDGSVWESAEEAMTWAENHISEITTFEKTAKAKATEIAMLKDSARAKLIAGEPLTEEEAATIVP